MLTPPAYQHRQNNKQTNKQTKTNILHALKTNKTKQFFFVRISLRLYKIDACICCNKNQNSQIFATICSVKQF